MSEGYLRHLLSEEIADLAVFLASDKAAFITGVPISIDGGFTTH